MSAERTGLEEPCWNQRCSVGWQCGNGLGAMTGQKSMEMLSHMLLDCIGLQDRWTQDYIGLHKTVLDYKTVYICYGAASVKLAHLK